MVCSQSHVIAKCHHKSSPTKSQQLHWRFRVGRLRAFHCLVGDIRSLRTRATPYLPSCGRTVPDGSLSGPPLRLWGEDLSLSPVTFSLLYPNRQLSEDKHGTKR